MKKIIWRILAILLLAVLAGAIFVTGCRLFLISNTRGRIRSIFQTVTEAQTDGQYDAIVVLGASVYRDGVPSPILKNRLDTAAELFQAGVAKKIIVTGDHDPGNYDEPDNMRAYLMKEWGISKDYIRRDYEGFSTYESMERMAKTFRVKRILVVTQHFHIYRALYIAQSFGLDAYGVIAETAGDIFSRGKWTAREWLATIKDIFFTTGGN